MIHTNYDNMESFRAMRLKSLNRSIKYLSERCCLDDSSVYNFFKGLCKLYFDRSQNNFYLGLYGVWSTEKEVIDSVKKWLQDKRTGDVFVIGIFDRIDGELVLTSTFLLNDHLDIIPGNGSVLINIKELGIYGADCEYISKNIPHIAYKLRARSISTDEHTSSDAGTEHELQEHSDDIGTSVEDRPMYANNGVTIRRFSELDKYIGRPSTEIASDVDHDNNGLIELLKKMIYSIYGKGGIEFLSYAIKLSTEGYINKIPRHIGKRFFSKRLFSDSSKLIIGFFDSNNVFIGAIDLSDNISYDRRSFRYKVDFYNGGNVLNLTECMDDFTDIITKAYASSDFRKDIQKTDVCAERPIQTIIKRIYPANMGIGPGLDTFLHKSAIEIGHIIECEKSTLDELFHEMIVFSNGGEEKSVSSVGGSFDDYTDGYSYKQYPYVKRMLKDIYTKDVYLGLFVNPAEQCDGDHFEYYIKMNDFIALDPEILLYAIYPLDQSTHYSGEYLVKNFGHIVRTIIDKKLPSVHSNISKKEDHVRTSDDRTVVEAVAAENRMCEIPVDNDPKNDIGEKDQQSKDAIDNALNSLKNKFLKINKCFYEYRAAEKADHDVQEQCGSDNNEIVEQMPLHMGMTSSEEVQLTSDPNMVIGEEDIQNTTQNDVHADTEDVILSTEGCDMGVAESHIRNSTHSIDDVPIIEEMPVFYGSDGTNDESDELDNLQSVLSMIQKEKESTADDDQFFWKDDAEDIIGEIDIDNSKDNDTTEDNNELKSKKQDGIAFNHNLRSNLSINSNLRLCEYFAEMGCLCRNTDGLENIPLLINTVTNIYDDPRSDWFIHTLCNIALSSLVIYDGRDTEQLKKIMSITTYCLTSMMYEYGNEIVIENTPNNLDMTILMGHDDPYESDGGRLMSVAKDLVSNMEGIGNAANTEYYRSYLSKIAATFLKEEELISQERFSPTRYDAHYRKKILMYHEMGLRRETKDLMPRNYCPLHYLITKWNAETDHSIPPLRYVADDNATYNAIQQSIGSDSNTLCDDLVLAAYISYILSFERNYMDKSKDIRVMSDLFLDYHQYGHTKKYCDMKRDAHIGEYERFFSIASQDEFSENIDTVTRTEFIQTMNLLNIYGVNDYFNKIDENTKILYEIYGNMMTLSNTGENRKLWLLQKQKISEANGFLESLADKCSSSCKKNRIIRASEFRMMGQGKI